MAGPAAKRLPRREPRLVGWQEITHSAGRFMNAPATGSAGSMGSRHVRASEVRGLPRTSPAQTVVLDELYSGHSAWVPADTEPAAGGARTHERA